MHAAPARPHNAAGSPSDSGGDVERAAREGWRRGSAGRWLGVAAVVLAGLAQLLLLPLTAASGLLAPLWAVGVLYVLWLAAAVAVGVLARRRPVATPLVPLANAALWWLMMTAGERLLGWTP